MTDINLPSQYVDALFRGAHAPGRYIAAAVQPFHLEISPRAGGVRVAGDEVAVKLAVEMLERLSEAAKEGGVLGEDLVRDTASTVVEDELKHDLAYRLKGLRNAIRPMSLSQVAFMDAMLKSDRELIFGVGPTGTGKTHLAVAAGLSLLADGRFKSFKITRPRVRLEGEVMTPALRAETAYDEQLMPIEDVLRDLIGIDEIRRMTEHGLIEILPLGSLRGRTFNDSFILVDEAQNMTRRKMRMALTRLGRRSRMVVTGDPAQVDLRDDEPSGLAHVLDLIAGTDIALVHHFEISQIIRNDIVARLESLYAREGGPEVRAAA